MHEKIKKQDLHNASINWGAISKINKDEYLDIKTLKKIARYRGVDIGDIVEIKKE